MYFAISNALKKKFSLIFEEIFQRHPVFEKTEVYTKFPDEEKPKFALLLRSASGSSQKIGMDNYGGIKHSFSSLANLADSNKGNSIEWVRDDERNLKNISAPGFYIMNMIEDNQFTIDPFLLVDDEELEMVLVGGKNGAILKNTPVNPNSETIMTWDNIMLKRGIEYTINYENGNIIFNDSVQDLEQLKADYQCIGEQIGPFEIEKYTSNNTAIPGVILAFGDRLRKGDEQVIVVDKEQREAAKVYTGRWTMSMDLMGIAQDPDQQERLVDYAISIFWSEYQHKLTGEGIAINEFSLSGESEDLEMDVPEEYYYTGGISFSVDVDWELEVPIVSEVRNVNVSLGLDSLKKTLTNEKEEQFVENQFDNRMINSGHQVGLQPSVLEPVVVYPSPIRVNTLKYE